MESHEFDMFSFFEMTPDLVCIAGKDGFFKKVNKSALEKLEFTEEELFARPIATFQHHEDRDITARTRAELLGGTALVNFENRYITKSGKILWLYWTSIYVPDKEVVFAIAKDITLKKLVEKQNEEESKKFKGLASHFKSNVEKERKSIAYELHEDLAQLATAIKMDIEMIKSGSEGLTTFLQGRIENACEVSQLLIDKIRKISFSKSPNMLEQLGLNETLQWLCNEFATITNVPCSFRFDYNESDLTQDVKFDFFRICQESLNNIMQHAAAKSVEVSIEDDGKEICLTISDNGSGFEMGQLNETPGFTNMNRLATLINGVLDIDSAVGKGTKVCFTIAKHFI
ncbi:MAG TPA: ATP-binding protein [Segetibacter sp.]|jgi:PAS domain S-box-containing protein